MELLTNLLLQSLAVSALSMTLTTAKVSNPIRNLLDRWNCWLGDRLGDVFSCPYCFSHWVALPLAFSFPGVHGVLQVVTWWLAVVGLAAIWSRQINLLLSEH